MACIKCDHWFLINSCQYCKFFETELGKRALEEIRVLKPNHPYFKKEDK